MANISSGGAPQRAAFHLRRTERRRGIQHSWRARWRIRWLQGRHRLSHSRCQLPTQHSARVRALDLARPLRDHLPLAAAIRPQEAGVLERAQGRHLGVSHCASGDREMPILLRFPALRGAAIALIAAISPAKAEKLVFSPTTTDLSVGHAAHSSLPRYSQCWTKEGLDVDVVGIQGATAGM